MNLSIKDYWEERKGKERNDGWNSILNRDSLDPLNNRFTFVISLRLLDFSLANTIRYKWMEDRYTMNVLFIRSNDYRKHNLKHIWYGLNVRGGVLQWGNEARINFIYKRNILILIIRDCVISTLILNSNEYNIPCFERQKFPTNLFDFRPSVS